MKDFIGFPLAAIVATSSLSTATMGAVAIIDPGNATVITDTSIEAVFGYTFVVGPNDLLVTSLGLWDAGEDGFSVSHQVGFGMLDSFSASVVIPSGTEAPLIGEFRYVDLASPMVLERNTLYGIFVTGFSGSSDGFRRSVPGTLLPESSSDLMLDVSVYQHDIGLESPLTLIGGTPYIGPNFQYTVIPEPSESLLIAATFLGGLRRNRSTIK